MFKVCDNNRDLRNFFISLFEDGISTPLVTKTDITGHSIN